MHVIVRRNPWLWRAAIAVVTTAGALAFTRAFWVFLQHTPFLLGFAAAILSSRLAGRHAGLLAVLCGTIGFALVPLPLPQDKLWRLLFGFVVISGSFSWIVARRYEIEGALRASESRLGEAQQLAHVASWEWNVVDETESWSDEMYRILGVDVCSVTPSLESFRHFLDPDHRDTLNRALRQALSDGQPFQCENRVIRPNGDVRVVHVQGRVVLDDSGRATKLIGSAQDVTDRKAAEDTVRLSEQRLQTIIDAEPACVKLVAADRRLLDLNRAGLEMIGAEVPSDVVGHSVMTLVHPDDRSKYLELHRAAIGGSSARGEFRMVGLTGCERWVDAHVVPFETSIDGQPQRAVLSVSSDVTERKRLEEQLRHARQLEALGRLAGGIAHDFNNLLTSIGGFTAMVRTSLDANDPRRGDLYEVLKSAERAAILTRQLLAFSRRQVLNPRVLDLNLLISEVHQLLRRTIGENVELVLDLNPALEPVRADPTQLEQVLLNLAVNARDAMPEGGHLRFVTENVSVGSESVPRRPLMTPGRYVRLSVTDTGTGIPPEIEARIFEPFFTTKGRSHGTGLGLSMAYGFVKQSGGFIGVDSDPGRGTTFDIYLPAVSEAVEPAVRRDETNLAVGGSETILLAEDDAAVRGFAREVLTRSGYTVLEARDGDEALAVAEQHPGAIGLLITDVVMPGLAGRALAAKLAGSHPAIRVVYTSGHANGMMRPDGGRIVFLPKPFRPAELTRAIRAALDGPTPQWA